MEMLLSTTHSQRRDNKSDRDGDLPTIRNDSNADHPEQIDLISDEPDDDEEDIGQKTNRDTSEMKAESASMSENDDFLYYNYASDSEDDNEFNDFDMIEPTNAPSTMEFDLRVEEQVSNDAKRLDLTKAAGTDENFGRTNSNVQSNQDETDTNPKTMAIVDQTQPIAHAAKRNTTKRFKCEVCEFSTLYKGTLTRHIRTHTGERPFECKVCEKQFTRNDTLNRHMKTHSKMFAFQCLRCHKRFSDETTWDLHEERCISNVVCTKTIPLVNFDWLNTLGRSSAVQNVKNG